MALEVVGGGNVVPLRRAPLATETKRELAARWGVSARSIERWMKDAGLPYCKPFEHGMVRFVPAEVDAWLNRQGER